MTKVSGFSPIARTDARVLILGSMPGVASLRAGEYYAHPRNSFWAIMGELIGAGRDVSYRVRIRRLVEHRIALWDVMQSCVRPGSGDAEIVEESIVPNDFAEFFEKHPRVRRVYFNGVKAEQVFRRYVLRGLGERGEGIEYVRLPSTSPAHAGQTYRQKLAAWRVVVED